MNNKGLLGLPIIAGIFAIGFILIGITAVAHIPAWIKAKKAHCEKEFQNGDVNCGSK